MVRMNIYLDEVEDAKLERLKFKFKKNSKEDVIKSLIKQFPELLDTFNVQAETSFDVKKETNIDINKIVDNSLKGILDTNIGGDIL